MSKYKSYASLSKMYTVCLLHLNCHYNNVSQRCLQWIKSPKQIAWLFFIKHHGVFCTFRIKSKVFYMASQALYILATDIFDTISIHYIWGTITVFYFWDTPSSLPEQSLRTSCSLCLEKSDPNVKWQSFSFQLPAQFLPSQRNFT